MLATQLAQQVETAHLAELLLGKHHIEWRVVDCGQRLPAVQGADHLIAFTEQHAHQAVNLWFEIHDQYAAKWQAHERSSTGSR